ncbi:MAG: anthranilate synthase component I family protein [Phycisphaerales bacterium]|nr:anthranilate synthase component I family protein [Phycisphaerales bacterium]
MSPAQRLDWNVQPLDVLRRWPRSVALAALLSGDDSCWSRVSVIGVPSQWKILRGQEGLTKHDVLAWIRSLDVARADTHSTSNDGPPMGAGWFTQFSYELGGVLEPTACANPNSFNAQSNNDTRIHEELRGGDTKLSYETTQLCEMEAVNNTGTLRATSAQWPLAQAARCDQAFVFDHVAQQWWSIGGALDAIQLSDDDAMDHCECAALQEETSDKQYAKAVARTIALIHAGDLFQANIARRWRSELRGSPRAFAHLALSSSAARYGAWLETDNGMLASMSPELFLELDANRRVISRPIKGTRSSEVGAEELAGSEKDAAELHMIVDLMRNDLSRVCQPGTVRVRQTRVMETHGTVVHGVAEIHGQLHDTCDRAQLLTSTFPPGSITGAPKIRAMQVIDELENFVRGPYCGAIGYFADTGAMKLSVAIRTATLRQTLPNTFALTYAAGCGITSDSKPHEEVAETHAKVRVLEQAIQAAQPSHI